jgi:uncharacterized protein (DUF952 family)
MGSVGKLLFHIVSAADWAKRRLTYVSPLFTSEGYIHCSTARQPNGVANRKFRGRDDLVVLIIDSSRVTARIRYECPVGSQEAYPHIYGALNIDAVIACEPLRANSDGRFSFEEWGLDLDLSHY